MLFKCPVPKAKGLMSRRPVRKSCRAAPTFSTPAFERREPAYRSRHGD